MTTSDSASSVSSDDLLDAVGEVGGRELDIGIGDQDAAAEGLEQPHDPRADLAIADDADGHFGKLFAGAVGAIEIAAPHSPARSASWPRVMRRVSARMAPMVNSATAEALRPGVLTTSDAALACGVHVDIDRAAARHGDEFERRAAGP